MSDDLPRWIEIRTPPLTSRHLIDFDRLPGYPYCTAEALSTYYASAIMELRAKLIEDAILAGANWIEVQIDGDRNWTRHTVPSWRFAFRARLKVTRARWKHRHPDAAERFWSALAYCGSVWSVGPIALDQRRRHP